MDFKSFERVVKRRASKIHRNGMQQWSLSDWFTEFTGECGEAANIVKKLNRIRDGLVGNDTGMTEEELMEKLADECGDAAISLQLFCLAAGINLEAATARKFNKTSEKLRLTDRLYASTSMPLFVIPPKRNRYVLREGSQAGLMNIYDIYRKDNVLEGIPHKAAQQVADAFNERT
jgi:NTP pyrophosphatase (non-canonical NTP hydrolase)